MICHYEKLNYNLFYLFHLPKFTVEGMHMHKVSGKSSGKVSLTWFNAIRVWVYMGCQGGQNSGREQ